MNTFLRCCSAIAKGWRWCVDPVCSADGKPSHPKLVTWALLGMLAVGRQLPVVTVIALCASSYGLKAYLMFLQHDTTSAASTDASTRMESHTVVEDTKRILTYTEAGEPAASLPEQPDARTPAGGE